jgi:hypothetical protein
MMTSFERLHEMDESISKTKFWRTRTGLRTSTSLYLKEKSVQRSSGDGDLYGRSFSSLVSSTTN